MTRAGSKLVLRTSPAPGHYLCIKWDFASLPLRAAPLRISLAYPHDAQSETNANGAPCGVHCGSGVQRLVAETVTPAGHHTIHRGNRWAIVQRLVAKTLDVERETALVVGSDNVLLGVKVNITKDRCCANCCLTGVLSQWVVSQFGEVERHI